MKAEEIMINDNGTGARFCARTGEEGIDGARTVTGVRTPSGIIYGNNILVATGGKTHQKTGSTGDGYAFAQSVGHSLIPPKKALYPFGLEETDICGRLTGITIDAEVKFINISGLLHKETGSILFAEFGISGPIIINASLVVAKSQMSGLTASINFFSGKDTAAVSDLLVEKVSASSNKGILNIITELLPKALAEEIMKKTAVDPDKKGNQLTKEDRDQLAAVMTGMEFRITKYVNINKSVATDGGVDLKEIDNKTLESKLVKGLYFAGEVMDVIGKTGGFNIQVAWSTGWTVGENVN